MGLDSSHSGHLGHSADMTATVEDMLPVVVEVVVVEVEEVVEGVHGAWEAAHHTASPSYAFSQEGASYLEGRWTRSSFASDPLEVPRRRYSRKQHLAGCWKKGHNRLAGPRSISLLGNLPWW